MEKSLSLNFFALHLWKREEYIGVERERLAGVILLSYLVLHLLRTLKNKGRDWDATSPSRSRSLSLSQYDRTAGIG